MALVVLTDLSYQYYFVLVVLVVTKYFRKTWH